MKLLGSNLLSKLDNLEDTAYVLSYGKVHYTLRDLVLDNLTPFPEYEDWINPSLFDPIFATLDYIYRRKENDKAL